MDMKYIVFLMLVGAGMWLAVQLMGHKTRRTGNRFTPRETIPSLREVLSELNGTKTKRTTYRDKFKLLNNGEKQLYFLMCNGMPKFIVLAQVSMSQIFHIKESEKYKQIGEIGRKSVDFLICRKDFSIVAAIELNSKYHDNWKQRMSDETKKRTLEEAGIPLLIYRQGELPTIESLRKDVAHAIVKRREYEEKRDQRLQRTPFVS